MNMLYVLHECYLRYLNQIRQLAKAVFLMHMPRFKRVPGTHPLLKKPRQKLGAQHSSVVTDVPQMIPPWLWQTFWQELGQVLAETEILEPRHVVPPTNPCLHPPWQHSMNVVPQTTPPNIWQQ